MPFLYVLSAPDDDLELAQAELWAMSGCQAEGRIGLSHVACDVSRSAYTSVCGQVIARADSFESLRAAAQAQKLQADKFRIDVRKLAPKPGIPSAQVAVGIADVLSGYPDLDNPRERYLVLCSEGHWWLSRVLSSYGKGFLAQAQRPWNLSQALAARHARAFVNLVAAPGDTVLDACCGAGTCVIEALHMGVRARGIDIRPANARIAEANLRHFGLPGPISVQDARHVQGLFDAAIIDFPYGHSTTVSQGLYEDMLNNLAPKAFRIAVILGGAGEELFCALGLQVMRCARVRASSFSRHFYILRGLRADSGPCGRPARPDGICPGRERSQ